jgi:hypothetical protein
MANTKNIDWANHSVDEAGYVISTYDRLRSEADTLLLHASETPSAKDVFGDMPTVSGERQQAAAMLRAMAARLQTLASELDGPQVDERNSPRVGWDAAHSLP